MTEGGAPETTLVRPDGPPRRPVADAVPWSIQVAAAWSWRLLLVGLGVAVVLLGLAVGKVIWVPVVVALLLTVLFNPVVDRMSAHVPRWAAAGLTVVVLIAFVGGLLVLAGRQIVVGFAALWEQTQAGFATLLEYLAESPFGLDAAALDGYLQEAQSQLSENSGMIVSGALSVTITLGQVLAGAIIALFCLFFFLKDGRIIWAWLLRLLPQRARTSAYEASRRGARTLGSYVRAQILVAGVDAAGIGLGAAILGLPLVVPLTVLVFLGSFIPFVGAIATGAIAVLVALVDQGVGTALIMLAIVLGVQQLEGNILQPLLLGHAVSLHPVAVLLAVTAGSLGAGIIGALLAVPFAATLNTVVLYLHGRDKFPELGRDPGGLAARLAALEGSRGADSTNAGTGTGTGAGAVGGEQTASSGQAVT